MVFDLDQAMYTLMTVVAAIGFFGGAIAAAVAGIREKDPLWLVVIQSAVVGGLALAVSPIVSAVIVLAALAGVLLAIASLFVLPVVAAVWIVGRIRRQKARPVASVPQPR